MMKTRPRTVLEVAKNADGEVVISVVVESATGPRTHSLTIQPHDVVALIAVLRQYIADEDAADLDQEEPTTSRSLRPVT